LASLKYDVIINIFCNIKETSNSETKDSSLESEKVSVMDMGIIISLKEYVNRIISLYLFKDTYPDFKRIYGVKNMLSSKLWIYLNI
jgi:hypothetical protein